VTADVTCSRCRKTVELAYARARWRRSGDSWDCRTHELGRDRLRILQAVAAGEQPRIPPIQLAWLKREGYLVAVDGPRPPRAVKVRLAKKRRVALTDLGRAAVVQGYATSPD
jgi:hypothetical protein